MLCFFIVFAFTSPETWGCQDQSWVQQQQGKKKMQIAIANVNSMLAHNKLPLMEAYNTIHKYILWISETYLDSSVSVDDISRFLPGYSQTCLNDHLFKATTCP